MAVSLKELLQTVNINLTGDIGPFTTWTHPDGTTVVYIKSPPKEPPSTMQLALRNRWKATIERWLAMPKHDRLIWSEAVRRASLKITPVGFFIYTATKYDLEPARTVERITHLTLPGIPTQ